MKNVNQLTVVLLAYILCGTTYAQVYTPNGTSVDYLIFSEGNIATIESQAADWISQRGWTDHVIKTAPATGEYNCHSYAWNMSEGGSTVWISAFLNSDVFNLKDHYSTPPTPQNIQKYWNDDSYVEVNYEDDAIKVWYGSCWYWNSDLGEWENRCDHSAIRITTGTHAGKYESKWGAWPRYIHPEDKSPYNSSNKKYYIRKPAITGPDKVCYDGSAFTLNDSSSGTITWSVTGPFSFSSSSSVTSKTGNPVTVFRRGTSTNNGILTANSGGYNAAASITPCLPTITGPDDVCYDGSTFTLSNSPSGTITWSVTGPFSFSSSSSVTSKTGNPVTVFRRGTSTSNGILTANIGGYNVAASITPCVPPVISGSSDICAASFGTFTVSNAPEGFTWGSSLNLTKISSGGTYADFSVSGYSDAAWVSINLNGMEVARHNLVVVFDAPVVAEITGPENISTYGFYTAVFSSISPATYCDWATYNSYAHVNGNGYSYIYINYDGYYYPSLFTLLLIATNACGEGLGSKGISATGSESYVSSYPNPVSDILQIEIDQHAIARAEALRQTTTDGKSLKIDPTYDIRLYDGQGNLLRRTTAKGGKVEFNVAGLTTGIYYLHVYDETGNKPEVRQIVVQH
ncbi:MAG: T9SS type A sorting domain-containing protein [Tannerellaceae bacterium]|jgi:hypothetical protein|nr:T9SS type A sorting domain-containing protein [Tannerellaceae bacterium]